MKVGKICEKPKKVWIYIFLGFRVWINGFCPFLKPPEATFGGPEAPLLPAKNRCYLAKNLRKAPLQGFKPGEDQKKVQVYTFLPPRLPTCLIVLQLITVITFLTKFDKTWKIEPQSLPEPGKPPRGLRISSLSCIFDRSWICENWFFVFFMRPQAL